MRVLVTGALGNLGGKLADHLATAAWCGEVVGVDNRAGAGRSLPKVENVVADLTDPNDARWVNALTGMDALVHFATRNPLPDCTWDEASESLAMTAGLLDAALKADVRRFVFASSNHVMGGYKDAPLAETVAPGGLRPDTLPAPGTLTIRDGVSQRPIAYATSKLYGEALVLAKARASGGTMTGVSVRIGWCQPGINDPSTINARAMPLPPEEVATANAANPSALAWFLGMWLSNRDFVSVMERAIRADARAWPAPAIVINGVSGNEGTLWDLDESRRLVGYVPQDDSAKVRRGH